MRHLDLFSGIGGFALAARRVGWETVQFVEIDDYCQKVLAKNFPGVPIHDDIQTYTGAKGSADIITAGWPCQDISNAGTKQGLAGERSGLWREVARTIRDIRPGVVVLENVSALLARGMGDVIGELAEIGYDTEWHCIPATAVNAPHLRDRVWIVAYPIGSELRNESGRLDGQNRESQAESANDGSHGPMADADCRRCEVERQQEHGELESESGRESHGRSSRRPGKGPAVADTSSTRGALGVSGPHFWKKGRPDLTQHIGAELGRTRAGAGMDWWSVEPSIRGMADGVSDGLDTYRGRVAHGVENRAARLKSLGNALVPQIAQALFEALDRSCR